MTNLTEKWKKGELPEGFYYFKLPNGEIIVGTDYCIATYLLTTHSDRCEVLSEVPSFEQWQASEKYNKHLEEVIKIYERKDKQATETSIAYNELAEENDKLKEQMNKYILDSINRGTANTVKAVKEFGMPERIKELVEQNTKFKEVLKDCREFLEILTDDNTVWCPDSADDLLAEIVQVLGEE